MTNQLETAKQWIADLNKIIVITDNECTKQKRDVLEWLVESIYDLKLSNKILVRGYRESVNKNKDYLSAIKKIEGLTDGEANVIARKILEGETK